MFWLTTTGVVLAGFSILGLITNLVIMPRYRSSGRHWAAPTISNTHIEVFPQNGKRRWDGKSDRYIVSYSDRPNRHSVAYLGAR